MSLNTHPGLPETPTKQIEAVTAAKAEPTQPTDEEKAGVYMMIQFVEGPFSIRYQRVSSKQEPNPLAAIAVLQDIIDRLRVALAFQQEVGMAAQLERMQAQMAAPGVFCPKCKAQQPDGAVKRILEGKVVFCNACHQKIGG